MRIPRPTPSMGVAVAALVMASTGSAVAAADFVKNAGAVDGKSAVASSSTLRRAAGKLVATASRGPDKGKLPGKFVSDVQRGGASGFGRQVPVPDNATGAPAALVSVPGFGTLAASCHDQNPKAGTGDPATFISFTNQSPAAQNVSTMKAGEAAAIGALQPNTVSGFTVGGSNTFQVQVQNATSVLTIIGTVEQVGRNTGSASCIVFGTATRVHTLA